MPDALDLAADQIADLRLPDSLIALVLRAPEEAHARLQDIAIERFGPDARIGSSVRVTYPLDALLQIPHAELWSGPTGRIIDESAAALARELEGFSIKVFERHYGPLTNYSLTGYLRQNRIRVLNLVQLLRRRGLASGRVLEVGSLYGSFPLPLQRLGYQVTAVDRYREYPTLEPVCTLMEHAGVEIVHTTRDDEVERLAALGTYDCVISMAVVEHIPHTPRLFLESLRSHVRPGGLLVIDTPNLTRYWNRKAFAEGRSPFMDIRSQYFAEVPYEGHHREYTGQELVWMLEQLGGGTIELQYADYNMIQFDVIDRPHIECLLALATEPAQADTLLAVAEF